MPSRLFPAVMPGNTAEHLAPDQTSATSNRRSLALFVSVLLLLRIWLRCPQIPPKQHGLTRKAAHDYRTGRTSGPRPQPHQDVSQVADHHDHASSEKRLASVRVRRCIRCLHSETRARARPARDQGSSGTDGERTVKERFSPAAPAPHADSLAPHVTLNWWVEHDHVWVFLKLVW